jgi:choline dehydrogenase-like flavoprotein
LVTILDFTNPPQHWQRYVSPDGKRQDAAHRYIHPLLQDGSHPNLHILTDSKVIRVLFDESTPPRAIGIEYKPNADHQPELALSKPVHKTIKANKLVVITAGALGTPQILERSGVGNSDILRKAGVTVVVDNKVSTRMLETASKAFSASQVLNAFLFRASARNIKITIFCFTHTGRKTLTMGKHLMGF